MVNRDVDCPEVKFSYNNAEYSIKHIVLVPFFKLAPSEKYPRFQELHFTEHKLAKVVQDRIKVLHSPEVGSKLVVIFVVTHSTGKLMGINSQSEVLFIDGKFYKRGTYSDLGKPNKEGLKLHVDGHLVYFLTELTEVNANHDLHLALADAAQRGVFDDSLKPKQAQ